MGRFSDLDVELRDPAANLSIDCAPPPILVSRFLAHAA